MKINIADVLDGLAKLDRAARDQSPLFRALKRPMKDDQRNHQKLKMGPDGPWPARSKLTKERGRFKRKGASGVTTRKRLAPNLLGKLSTSISLASSARNVIAASKIPWSMVHQEGGKVGRGSVLPARPFMWMSEDFLKLATDQIGDRLLTQYGAK